MKTIKLILKGIPCIIFILLGFSFEIIGIISKSLGEGFYYSFEKVTRNKKKKKSIFVKESQDQFFIDHNFVKECNPELERKLNLTEPPKTWIEFVKVIDDNQLLIESWMY